MPARLTYTEPHYEGKSVIGEIVYVDRFGTLVTNLTTELVPPYAVLEVEDLDIGPLRRTFGDVPTGGLLAYVGSGGAVEIAVRDGSAARRLGLGVGGRMHYRQPLTTLDDHLARGCGSRRCGTWSMVSRPGRRRRSCPETADLAFGPPILRPPSLRDFYAFEGHVRTMWERRGGEVPETWYRLPIFYFSNVSEVRGPG